MHLLDEVTEHLLGHVEVGDDAILQRANGGDIARGTTQHALRLNADGVHITGPLVDCDHRRLRQNDAATLHVNKSVGGAEVHGHIAAAEPRQVTEKPDRGPPMV